MNINVRISAAELCTVKSTGNHWSSLGFQHWGEPHDNALIMYLTAQEARDIAAHFEALADAMDARRGEQDTAA